MAQVESPFNPEYERKHEETYDFRGPDAAPARKGFTPKEYDNSFANSTAIFNAAVAGKDTLYKERIREEVTADVDAVRDPWIGAGPSSAAEGYSGPGAPADLRKQLDKLGKMDAQYRAGRINDRHYWAQMENIARATRSRYPGYREYIDNVISDITGGTPANVLQRQISSEAEKGMDDSSKKTFQIWKEYSQAGYALPENYTQMGLDQAMRYTNNTYAIDGKQKRDMQALEDQAKTGNLTSETAAATARSGFWTGVAREYQPQINQLDADIKELISSGRTPDPAAMKQMEERLATLRGTLASRYRQMLLSRPDIYGVIKPETRDAELQSIDKYVANIGTNIRSGNYELASSSANQLKLMTDIRAVELANSIPIALDIAAYNQLGGQAAVSQYFSTPNPDGNNTILGDFGKQIYDYQKKRLVNPNLPSDSTPVVSAIDKIANADEKLIPRKEKAVAIKDLVEKNIGVLVHPESSLATKERAAENWFGEGNQDFLKAFNPKNSNDLMKDTGMTRHQMFMSLNSPAVAKTMGELRTSSARGEELYQNYQDWRTYNFYALYKQELDTMKTIPVTDQTMNIQFDAETGKIIPQDRIGSGDAYVAGGGSAAGWLRKNTMSWINGSQAAINRYNALITAMTPTWEAEGKSPGEEAQKLLANAGGINFTAAKETSFADRFLNGLGEMFSRSAEGSSNVSARRSAAGIGGTGSRVPQQFSSSAGGAVEALAGINDIVQTYTPGNRESTNVEDRRLSDDTMDEQTLMSLLTEAISNEDDAAMDVILEKIKQSKKRNK